MDTINRVDISGNRINIVTSDGTISFSGDALVISQIESEKSLLEGAIITGFQHDVSQRYVYLSYENQGRSRYLDFNYDQLL